MAQPAGLDPAILSVGLERAMAFGADWLKPIQTRLVARYPRLDPAALNAYSEECQRAMRDAQLRDPGFWNRADSPKEAFALWRSEVHSRDPWMTEKNLSRVWSQGCYYTHKDGDLKAHGGDGERRGEGGLRVRRNRFILLQLHCLPAVRGRGGVLDGR